MSVFYIQPLCITLLRKNYNLLFDNVGPVQAVVCGGGENLYSRWKEVISIFKEFIDLKRYMQPGKNLLVDKYKYCQISDKLPF